MKVAVCLVLILLMGCADYSEIDRVTFPASIGIDYDEKNEEIRVFTRITEGTQDKYLADIGHRIIRGSGKTFGEALVETIDKNLQEISWKHSDVVLVTKDLARRGLINEMDLLYRLDEVLINAFLIITNDDLEKIFEATLDIQTSLPIPLAGIAGMKKQSLHVKDVTIMDFLMDYLKDGKQPIVPIIRIKQKIDGNEDVKFDQNLPRGDHDLKNEDEKMMMEDENEKEGEVKTLDRMEEKVLEFSGIAIFEDDKFVGNLSKEESMGVMMVFGFENARGMSISNKLENEFDLVIDNIKTKTNIETYVCGKGIGARINLDVLFNIAQHSIPTSIEYDEVDFINREVENYIKGVLDDVIFKLQNEFKTDTIGIGERVFRQNTKYWMENKHRWNEIFPKIPIRVNVDAKLKSTGQLVDNFKKSVLKY